MTISCQSRLAVVLFSLLATAWWNSAHAQVSFVSPAENASLAKTSVLNGICTGSKHVVLNGPGIAKNKTISCQKSDKQSRFWSYSLTNAYNNMPEGSIPLTASQDGQHAQRTFFKSSGSSAPAPVPVKCYLNGHTIGSGNSIKAFRSRTVTSGQSCISEVRMCTNGSLSGSYAFASCTAGSASAPPPTPTPILPPAPPATPVPAPAPTPSPAEPAPSDSASGPQKAPG